MDLTTAVPALGALAQPRRLEAFRLLVRHGPDGLPAGDLATRLCVPPSSLSFHLRDLCAAGLLRATRSGRSIRYAVVEPTFRELLWFLGEDCCQGRAELCPSPRERIEALARTPRQAGRRPRVLFLCSRNAARSQLAEALLRQLAGDRFECCSAGLRPARLHPLTRAVLAEAAVPTDGLRSKDLGDLVGKLAFDHVIVVCPDAWAERERLPTLAADVQFWPFVDPAAATGPEPQRRAAFRACRDAIRARLQRWLRRPPTSRRRTPTPPTTPTTP
jgi:protein-tyrosine-phosphatase/DNA-binding transcriptional ArsR family regulator